MHLDSRTPHGVRGLKWRSRGIVLRAGGSHPSRGAWIEMVTTSLSVLRSSGRTPHGVRGLKSATPIQRVAVHASHPSRGAWIEIIAVMSVLFVTACRTPHGVRGLKWHEQQRGSAALLVAPLTGCVD